MRSAMRWGTQSTPSLGHGRVSQGDRAEPQRKLSAIVMQKAHYELMLYRKWVVDLGKRSRTECRPSQP